MTAIADDRASRSAPYDRRRSGWRIASNALSILLVAAPIVVMSPPRITRTGGGIDFSWMLGLNVAVSRHFHFGSAVNFTYGPLGFLLYPFPGSHLWIATGFWLAVDILLIWHVVRSLPDPGRLVAAASFSALWTAAELTGIWPEYRLLLLLAVLELAMVKRPTKSAGVVIGGLTAIGIFLKFTIGVAMMVTVGASVLVALFRRDRRYASPMVWGSVSGLAVTALLAAWFMGSVRAGRLWLHASVDISSGYGIGLSRPVSGAVVAMSIVAILASVVIVGVLWRKGYPGSALLGLMLLPAIAVVYKHAFIRHGGLLLFPFLLAFSGIAVARMPLRAMAFGLPAALLVVLSTVGARHTCPHTPGAECWAYLGSSYAAEGVPVAIDTINRGWDRGPDPSWLASDRLPESVTKLIEARPGATVDVIPWEIGMTAANDLTWAPNKIMQTYQAYRVFLDQLSASSYLGPAAPDFVIFRFSVIDGRHPALEAPDTLRTLLSQYRVVEVDLKKALFLLERRTTESSPHSSVAYRGTAVTSSWISVPDALRAPILRANFRLSRLGALRLLVASIPEVDVQLEYASGRSYRYRVTPELFDEGVGVGTLPYLSTLSFQQWLQGRFTDHVVRMRFSGPGLSAYRQALEVEWLTG